ncbi:MAG: iron donor protein CyaY [Rhodospirillaceae bacterium]|nr:iron donor protein CyaY [Rhodospirillaceae bacterium]
MDDSSFEKLAGRTIDGLFEALDAAIGDSAEIDIEGGILTIETADGGRYVINRHGPNRQIWLSSPKSGAWHFERKDDAKGGAWVSTRGSERLDQVLASEFGIALALD